MRGIDRRTGKALTGWPLFVSHAGDVLTTQIGSREKRRDYGSRCPELRGKNNGPTNQVLVQAYVAEAFADPNNGLSDRFTVTRIDVTQTVSGFLVKITGIYRGRVKTFDASI